MRRRIVWPRSSEFGLIATSRDLVLKVAAFVLDTGSVVAGIISELKAQAKRPERVSIYLDGKYVFGVHKTLAVGLQVGQRLTDGQIHELKLRDAEKLALGRASRLIARRPRSELEMRRYFDRHGVPVDVQERAMEHLRDQGLLDDLEFAKAWIENRRLFRPRGRFALRYELRRKGIADEVIETALNGFDEEEAAVKAARKAARRWRQLSADDFRNRVGEYLTRRGFPFTVIPAAAEHVWQELNAAQDESEVAQ